MTLAKLNNQISSQHLDNMIKLYVTPTSSKDRLNLSTANDGIDSHVDAPSARPPSLRCLDAVSLPQ